MDSVNENIWLNPWFGMEKKEKKKSTSGGKIQSSTYCIKYIFITLGSPARNVGFCTWTHNDVEIDTVGIENYFPVAHHVLELKCQLGSYTKTKKKCQQHQPYDISGKKDERLVLGRPLCSNRGFLSQPKIHGGDEEGWLVNFRRH